MGAKLLTAKEIARELNVSPSTITDWGRQGKIPRVKVSHKIIRYDPEAVQSALLKMAADKGGNNGR
jgi:excisionase family DNA binding protein